MSDLNDRIDEVARQMTAGTPPDGAAFRRGVLARIDGHASPRRTWRASFVLTPIAVAAAIVIALFVARDRGPGPSGPGETAGPKGPALQAEAPANVPPQITSPQGPSAFARAEASRASTRPAAAQAPAAQFEPNGVASIAVAPLTVEALTPESIEIPQLDAVAPIGVAPLDINDSSRRNP